MIKRILATLGALLLYFCAATFIAEVIMLCLWSWSWKLDRQKLVKMLAVAQGIDQVIAPPQPVVSPEEAIPEQPSYEEVLKKRALMLRDLELRQMSLSSAV